MIRWPRPAYWARTALRVALRIAARARPVTTSVSQAAGGVCSLAVITATSSPLKSSETSGAVRPLTRQPTAVHGRVQRAVVVLLGRRDVILEAAGHERPFGVDDAECPVAILLGIHQHAEGEDVGKLLEGDLLLLGLLEDRIGTLLAALDG